MFKNGKLLVEVATGKSPALVETTVLSSSAATTEDIDNLDLVLQQNILQLEDFRKTDLRHSWAGQSMPVLQGPVQAVQKMDAMFNLSFTSIVDDPVQIEEFAPVNVSTLPEWRADESLTFVYWTRMEARGRIFYWYLDKYQPIIHEWIDKKQTNIRFTSGPGTSSGSSGLDFIDHGVETRYDGPAWRLSILVYDANTKSMRKYLDGQLLYDSSTTGSNGGESLVPELPRVDAIFPKGPDEVAGIGQGGYIGGVAHMRMYKSVWTGDMIRQYQQEASAQGVKLRECKNSDEFSDDPLWIDAFGHGCSWFAVAMQQRPLARTCDQVAASVSCPVACESVTQCWGGHPSLSTNRWLLESPRKRLQHLGRPVLCTRKRARAHKRIHSRTYTDL